MESLKTTLTRALKDAGRVAILGVGSTLRGDDAAGMQVADQLRRLKIKPRAKVPHSAIRVFLGETAPENLTGEIKKFRPTHLVILDSADLSKKPGSISIIEHELLGNASSISTHNMPVNVLIQYIQASVPCQVLILGIQPKSHEYNQPLTPAVQKAATRAAAALAAALRA